MLVYSHWLLHARHVPKVFTAIDNTIVVVQKGGTVDGTLIVTPNAVMFDPYVCDPLVIEHGVEEYGMIAKLDTLISLAIYRDSEAMHALHQQK